MLKKNDSVRKVALDIGKSKKRRSKSWKKEVEETEKDRFKDGGCLESSHMER